MASSITQQNTLLQPLRTLTQARIVLGRAGQSIPTHALLQFQAAHASARTAVHQAMDQAAIANTLSTLHLPIVYLHSQAKDRVEYLQRPDLGRLLDADAAQTLQDMKLPEGGYDISIMVGDGLSAAAINKHAVAMVRAIAQVAHDNAWTIAPIALVAQARVAIGDPIGRALHARAVIVLIGERPGLSSPDSLGIYITWGPHTPRTDADRNCISNIHAKGLSYEEAAHKVEFLLKEAFRRGLSGVQLKDETTSSTAGESLRISVSFLLD